ncbi:MAG: hypothetical protein ACU0DK_00990 [Pseudooceanicola sp.]
MAKSNKVLVAAGAIGTAAAIGFLMQSGERDVVRGLSPAEPVQEMVLEQTAFVTDPLPEPPARDERIELSEIVLTSSLSEVAYDPPIDAPKAAPELGGGAAPRRDTLPRTGQAAADCAATLTATPTVAAMVELSFEAACAPGMRVRFEHEGMRFSATTDDAGRVDVTVPALAETANFSAAPAQGSGAEATVKVDSIYFYDRAVLQSRADAGMTLHALEFGSGYDGDGHIWRDVPRDASVAARSEGGFLVQLGEADIPGAELAQVYTFPSATAKSTGEVQLSVEAEVLSGTCARDVTARILQVNRGVRQRQRDIAITMPDCEAVGDFLLLKTPLNDLKIASR